MATLALLQPPTPPLASPAVGAACATASTLPRLPLVLAEPVALQQIIHNLLMNALQALDQVPATERRLRIGLAQRGAGQVALSVRDHGPCIPPEARAHLFEPFYTTRTGGLVLGLTLCESLAQAMGAQLALAPAPAHPALAQRGAEFVLTLPTASPLLAQTPAHDG